MTLNELEKQIIKRVTEVYPHYGTFQDVDTAILSDQTIQYMLYFSNGGRAAYQTGWNFINIEREEDIQLGDEQWQD